MRYRKRESPFTGAYEEENLSLVIRGLVHDGTACRAALKRWLARKAKRTLVPWLQKISVDEELPYNRIFIKSQKTRWASCSRHKSISLNVKLLFLPTHLVRYVFIHELCHTRHMDHSRKYWTLLALKDPDYVEHDEELRSAWRHVPAWVV